jgi:hypothetical protein
MEDLGAAADRIYEQRRDDGLTIDKEIKSMHVKQIIYNFKFQSDSYTFIATSYIPFSKNIIQIKKNGKQIHRFSNEISIEIYTYSDASKLTLQIINK